MKEACEKEHLPAVRSSENSQYCVRSMCLVIVPSVCLVFVVLCEYSLPFVIYVYLFGVHVWGQYRRVPM